MNATLQCLANIKPVTEALLKQKKYNDIYQNRDICRLTIEYCQVLIGLFCDNSHIGSYKPEEFKRITDEKNNKSRKKIKDIEEEQKNVADTRKNMFGEDNNSIGKTSLITQIANLKKAEEGVDLIEEQLEEIKSLQDAIFSFKADISAGLIDPNSVKGHISANQDNFGRIPFQT